MREKSSRSMSTAPLIRETLPVMPKVAAKIIDTMADDLVSLQEVAEIIALDPAISARIIGLANSAYFGRHTEIVTVEDAIIRALGLDLARGIAIGMACSDAFDISQCPNFNLDRFWGDSLATSAIAKSLAAKTPLEQIDVHVCTLAGLLYRIGYLGFAAIEGSKFNRVLAESNEADPEALLRQRFGITPNGLGLELVQAWELPQSIIDFFADALASEPKAPSNWTVVCIARGLLRMESDQVNPAVFPKLRELQVPRVIDELNVPQILETTRAAASSCS